MSDGLPHKDKLSVILGKAMEVKAQREVWLLLGPGVVEGFLEELPS